MISLTSTILGLISIFKSERRATSDDEYKEFYEWLETKRHKTIIDEINTNHLLGLGIKNLLKQNHVVLLEKLERFDEVINIVISKIEGLGEISKAVAPDLELSDQALSVIKQLEASGGSLLTVMHAGGGSFYFVIDCNEDADPKIEITEERFIEDDLNQLIQLGFLLYEKSLKGKPRYRYTRLASKYLKQI